MEPMLNIAVKAARLAGKHILRGFDRPDLLKVDSKGHNDLVTNIDRESEQIITGTLLDAWPHHKITGEESGSSDSDADYEWVIDPLDGTMNFSRQIPHFCISIGCLHKGRLEHAVVLDPIRQEEFIASRGLGARLNGRRIRVSERKTLDGAAISYGGRNKEMQMSGGLEVMRELIDAGAVTRQCGSSALELAWIAAGRLDVLWMHSLGRWDLAAGALLVIEAGGLVGDFAGGVDYMQSGKVIAGTPKCFKRVTSLVKSHF